MHCVEALQGDRPEGCIRMSDVYCLHSAFRRSRRFSALNPIVYLLLCSLMSIRCCPVWVQLYPIHWPGSFGSQPYRLMPVAKYRAPNSHILGI